MGFQFKLEKVLDYRKTLRDVSQRDFQAALREVHLAEQEMEAMKESIWKSEIQRSEISCASPETIERNQAVTLQQIHLFIDLTKVKIVRQQKRIDALKAAAEELRVLLAEKAIEVKTMERLREKQKQSYLQERSLSESKEVDDLIVMRNGREDS